MSTSVIPIAPSSAQQPPASAWIVSPVYDLLFFILSPILALFLGIAISGSDLPQRSFMLGGYTNSFANCFLGTFIMAHLFLVIFRSHLNSSIFHAHPIRFTVVPLTLLLAMTASTWFAVSVTVLATWWDVYHSGLQTFGIGRIYDMRKGNDALAGRQLDRWLNLLLYAGPILAGATLMDHVNDFDEFEEVGSVFFTSLPVLFDANRDLLRTTILGFGIPFLCFYAFSYWRLWQRGYVVSWQKIALLVSTGLVSIFTWGFNTFGEAFFIMNFFHAWQYFAIVWWSEKKNLTRVAHVEDKSWGKPVILALVLAIAFGYGFWAETADSDSSVLFNIVIVVAIMHFWYDGFIWSVRKKQI